MSRLDIPSANDNTLNFVFPGGIKPSWKGNKWWNRTYGSAVPTSSQPQTNLSVNTGDNCSQNGGPCYDRSFRGLPNSRASGIYHGNRGNRGPLNPIKHWRKQLQPSQGHVTGKPTVDQVIWTPGGSSHLAWNTELSGAGCTDLSCAPVISNYLYRSHVDVSNCCTVVRNQLSKFQPVVINNPARKPRPRSSQTLLKKNYYTTGSAYLKARVKLYEQNQLLSSAKTNHGGSNFPQPERPPAGNNYVYPTNDLKTGTQAFNSTYCCATDISGSQTCCGVYVGADGNCGTAPGCRLIPVTFKPSNPFFSVQGAVDSSTRILQKRYAAITKNNFDFQYNNGESLQVRSITGNNNSPMVVLPGSTPSTYRGETKAPYFIKSKYQAISACQAPMYIQSVRFRERISGRMPSGGTGITTVCFRGSGGTGPAV